ncbi:hypothetical protein [Beijerinckia sp. L45]|uniref:hypothetical protein n=1 Tax=Beijerinckia sp. L45 TaxID=1641855 RepID=UPI00131C7178|nr:hypothetical protein [Beijerinckia sp. L45]
MTDVDYEAIEAAVTETVRGRWFLKEFARRNRGSEVKLMLDAMSRLETLVTASQTQPALPAPPSADPSIRLMVQRIKEIGGQLEGLASIMREDGVEAHYCEVVELQARAVAGLMRTGTMAAKPDAPARLEQPVPIAAPRAPEPRRLPHVNERPLPMPQADPRLDALSGLDGLPLAKKLALFT